MDNPFKSPAVISFCPGILGIERGLKRAGVSPRVMAYVEIEAFIIANLVAGMETGMVDPAPIWTDAKTFDARPFRGRIHGIIGGYPCPGESLAGLREGHLYKGFIWPSIRRAIAAARPIWCFFENVDDHITGTFPIVHRSLQNMGYAVEAGIFSAEEVGATHERQRLFILAVANTDCNVPRRFAGNIFSKGKETEGKKQRENGERLRNEYRNSGEETGYKMEYPYNTRREKLSGTSSIPQEITCAECAGDFLWPAPQGEYQHEWEEPRTVKPGVGCSAHGYNFRNDLLRALGNSVVEQTAELAFLTLLKKFTTVNP